MATSLTMMMTKKRKKKTRSNGHPLPAWHPPVLIPPSKCFRSSAMRPRQWIIILCTAALLAPCAVAVGPVQEPASPQPPGPVSAPAGSTKQPAKKEYRHADDFLIRGTVFNDKALSAPGVQLRIRRAGDKKFRWESYTNSRGEFAVRVPQGSAYEMVIRAKGFAEQTRTIDAKSGGNEQSIAFRLEPAVGGKK